MEIPESIDPNEELGRGVSSSRIARRASRPNFQVPLNVFLPPRSESNISVDRLSVVQHDVAVTIADRRDRERDHTFYGWAVISAAEASENERKVVASPIPNINYPISTCIMRTLFYPKTLLTIGKSKSDTLRSWQMPRIGMTAQPH
jgi:hypothetical protein